MATDLILGLIRQGLAVALLPSRFVKGMPDVVTVPLADGPTRVEYLTWSDFNPTPAATAFVKVAAGQPMPDQSTPGQPTPDQSTR